VLDGKTDYWQKETKDAHTGTMRFITPTDSQDYYNLWVTNGTDESRIGSASDFLCYLKKAGKWRVHNMFCVRLHNQHKGSSGKAHPDNDKLPLAHRAIWRIDAPNGNGKGASFGEGRDPSRSRLRRLLFAVVTAMTVSRSGETRRWNER